MADDAASDRLVAGRYRLRTLIGRGGAGVVWRGHDERLDRPVAVKEITFAAGADAVHAGRARALREARAAARLGGAGVVQIYDILEADDRAFLIMELVDAPNLQALVQRDGPLSPATAAALGLGLLDTLEAAHQVGIVHRDVKPSNVLIDGELPRLTDFGIARLSDDTTITTTGAVLGTPAYMAPELARGEPVGPAVDVYGLGVTLYFAVEGVAPFGDGGSLATMMAVINRPPRPMERAGPLAVVLDVLLAKDGADRPAADELRLRLAEIAALEHEWVPPPGDAPDDATPAEDADRAAPPAVDAAPVRSPPDHGGRSAVARHGDAADRPTGRGAAAGLALALVAVVAVLAQWGFDRDDDAPVDSGEVPSAAAAADPPSSIATSGARAAASDPPAGAAGGDTAGGISGRSQPPREQPGVARDARSDGILPDHDVAVPDDWVVFDAPDAPYSIAHPPGWQVVDRPGSLADVRDPRSGMYVRLDWVAERRDPVSAWEAFEPGFASRHADYRRVRLQPTTFKGNPAALWEYRYGNDGSELHAYNLGVNAGDFGYGINLQARQSDFSEARQLWPYFLASHEFDPP